MCSSSGKASAAAAAQGRKDDKDRSYAISRGTDQVNKQFQGFDNNFYDKRAQDYSDYYAPQVAQQYREAQRQQAFQLARQGTTESSAAAHENGILNQRYGDQQAAIASGAIDSANQARSQMETARGNLISELHSTADPASASQAAVNRAALLAQEKNQFSPLGDLFSNIGSLNQSYRQNQAYNPTQQQGLLAQRQAPAAGGGGSAKVING